MEFKGRFAKWMPEKVNRAELMLVQHMLAVLKSDGCMVTVMPHGVLFRGGEEQVAREHFITQGWLDAVTGLPSSLFYGTGIPACILVMNKEHAETRKDVLFINADRAYREGKAQNFLRPEDMAKMVDVYRRREDVRGYARVVPIKKFEAEGYNCNSRRYVDNAPPPEPQDVRAHIHGGVPVVEMDALERHWMNYQDLREACLTHVLAILPMVRKGRAERTIENYGDYMERLLGDWLEQPLGKFGLRPGLLIERHERLTQRNGPYVANSVMKAFRAIYNHALRGNRDLPAYNPALAIDWNPEYRRDTGLGVEDLESWFKELAEMDKPLRQEFHLLTLLTGSRPTAPKTVRIEHVNFKRRIIHIPKPKGGVEKAFDIPMSHAIMRCVIRAIRIGRQSHPVQSFYWLFPADSANGHMVETKEDRAKLSKWGNDLRQTYRTIAQAAEISELDIHLLMNHSLRGVNAGYITRDKLLRGHLRQQQERVSRMIFGSAKGRYCAL